MTDCVIHVFLQLEAQMLSFILSEVLYYEIKEFLVLLGSLLVCLYSSSIIFYLVLA